MMRFVCGHRLWPKCRATRRGGWVENRCLCFHCRKIPQQVWFHRHLFGGIVENLIAAIPPILEHKFQQIRHSCFWNCGWGISSVSCVWPLGAAFPCAISLAFFSINPLTTTASIFTGHQMENGREATSISGSQRLLLNQETIGDDRWELVQRPSCGKACEQ